MIDGIRLRLDLSDYVQWLAYFRVERALRNKLYGLVRPGNVVIDVGTNIGEVLLNLAKRAGPGGRAIGFEPNPETYGHCLQNLALNPTLPAELHAVALGESAGELSFGRSCASNSGGDRIMPTSYDTIQVPVTTLDLFAENDRLDRVDLIKIDVEGFELSVLRGSEDVIARFRPILFVELSDANLRAQGSAARELVEWLEKRGYAAENAETGTKVISDRPLNDCFFDIICRPL